MKGKFMGKRHGLRGLTVFFATVFALLLGASAAFAHVTVSSPNAVRGGNATVILKVPTESATASTTGVKLQLPVDTPFSSVTVKPKVGWIYTVTKTKLDSPIKAGHNEVSEVVTEIAWTATGAGIKPGEFDTFDLSVGPLPEDKDSVTFKAIQTYSDGTTANWVEESSGSTEPEHPAPTLALTDAQTNSNSGGSGANQAAGDNGNSGADNADGNGTGVTGIVLGGLGLLAGAAALVLVFGNRKRVNDLASDRNVTTDK